MSQVTVWTIPGSPLNMTDLAASLEELFAATASGNRGATAPSGPFEGMFWWDTSATPSEVLKRYTVAAGWVSLLTVNITTGVMTISGYIPSSLYNANTILAATTDNTPAAVTVAEQRILGRKTGGSIAALTGAEAASIIGINSVLPWALITDVKAATINGGGSVAVTYNQRNLNTITGSEGDGNQSWVTLASNQLTFSVGTYYIEASAPAFSCNSHTLYFYKSTAPASILLYGTSEYSAFGAQTRSFVSGQFVVTDAATVYRILHYTQSTYALNGLGRARAVGVNEVYTMAKITKLA